MKTVTPAAQNGWILATWSNKPRIDRLGRVDRFTRSTASILLWIAVIIMLASVVRPQTTANGTVASCSECPICCVTSADAEGTEIYKCTEDQLTCKLKPKTDFQVLLTTLLIILGFAVGIPLIVFTIDFLVIRRPCNAKMSICECCVNYLCLCICCKKRMQKNKTIKSAQSIVSKDAQKDLGNDEVERL